MIFGRNIFSLACFLLQTGGRSGDGHGARDRGHTGGGGVGSRGCVLASARAAREPFISAQHSGLHRQSVPLSLQRMPTAPSAHESRWVPDGAPKDGAFSFLKGRRVFSLYLVRKPSVFLFFCFSVCLPRLMGRQDLQSVWPGVCPHLDEGLSADGARLPQAAPCLTPLPGSGARVPSARGTAWRIVRARRPVCPHEACRPVCGPPCLLRVADSSWAKQRPH